MAMWEPVVETILNQYIVVRRGEIQQREQDHPSGRISYISKGLWVSKLLVQYTNDNNELEKREAKPSSCPIEIPKKAKNIEVRFKVMRFISNWCDVKKYDRFEECWSEPKEPHIFKYEKPVIRTFTISGSLYYEAVMKVCDDGNEEVDDM